MGDSEFDKLVLTYDEYIKLKEKFDTVTTFTSDIVKLDEIFHEAKITEDTKTNYLDAFKVLLKHIHDDGVFYGGNNLNACKYINYILYKEVEHNIHQSYNENINSIFKNFLDAYAKKYSRKYRCISDIYNIQPETYYKINPLYELYDKYKECIVYIDDNVRHVCGKFEDFLDSYARYMYSTKSESLKFNEILKNIEEHAKAAFSKYRKGCKKYNNHPVSPKLYKPLPEKIPENHNQVQKGQTILQSADTMSQSETNGITHTPQTSSLKDISISDPEHETPRTDEEYSANVFHSESDDHNEIISHPGSSHLERINFHIRTDEGQSQKLSKFQTPIRPSYPPGTSLYSGEYGHEEEKVISNEIEMSPPSVMSTISSALKDVDPVPVVGVSGGMGVLFLLFKYTPVGTFFRGRGYRQRIPTRFDGVYPGFYQGFEGFEEGYFPNNQINIAYGPE